MKEEDFKKIITIASSEYEPDKCFIEKLLSKILAALKSLSNKRENRCTDSNQNKVSKDKPP